LPGGVDDTAVRQLDGARRGLERKAASAREGGVDEFGRRATVEQQRRDVPVEEGA